jgi:hypothetical protein
VNFADEVPSSGALASMYRDAAKGVAERLSAADLGRIAGCPSGVLDADCVTAFAAPFAARAFRRPLEAEERQRLEAIVTAAAATSAERAAKLLVEAVLQAPSFVYRPELGRPAGPGVHELAPHELAAALSFFLQDALPDAELARAADGSLMEPGGVERQVDRLLGLERTQEALATGWLRWSGLAAGVNADLPPETFPEYTEPLRASMASETRRFLEGLVARGGTLRDLLTATRSPVDGALARLYGVSAPAQPFAEVSLPATQRAGLLTQASVIASLSSGSLVVHRGLFVKRQLLCGQIPNPPAAVDQAAPMSEALTERAQAEQRAQDPTCSTCHRTFDPLGLAFEQYDALGRLAEPTADATAELVGTDVDGPIDGAVDLARRLADSRVVRECLVDQMITYALGRHLQADDSCERDRIVAEVTAKDGELVAIARAIATSPLFRYRTQGEAP